MTRWLVGAVVAYTLGCGATVAAFIAQKEATTPTEAVPEVPADVKSYLISLQTRGDGVEFAISVLQKEVDGITAEKSRIVAKLQAAQPGYELTPQLTYVKKKDASSAPKH